MIGRVFPTIWNAIDKPSVIGPSAAGTVAAWVAFRLIGSTIEFWTLPVGLMLLAGLVVIAKAWLGLTVMASALRVMRRGFVPAPIYWVAAPRAFQVGFVSLMLLVPIAAGVVFFIVPGLWLAVRWSQAGLLILAEKAEWFDAAEASVNLTHGHKLEIFALWLIVGLAVSALDYVVDGLAGLLLAGGAGELLAAVPVLLLQIGTDALGLVLAAAVYHELDHDVL